MAMKKCPVCGVSVKDENLLRHVRNQHPHEKVEGLETMRPPRQRATRDWKDDLVRVGVVLATAGVVWFILALLIPSPVGVLVPAFPDLIVLMLVGVALLAAGWVLGSAALQRSATKLAVVGLVVGLGLAGVSTLLAAQQGVPTLNPASPTVGGWLKANNALWKINGLPVFFYYGSAGCPYCAASSWAVQRALEQFGTLTGWSYTTSSPNEGSISNIPEVDLAHATLTSQYLTLDVVAGDNNQVVSAPTPPPIENAYVLAYGTSNGAATFPFYVVGGIYARSGGLVPPTDFVTTVGGTTTAMTPQQVAQALASGSGSVYDAVHGAQVYVEAFLVKACQAAGITPPASVIQDPAVAAILLQI